MSLRILQILPSFDAGGVERVTLETVTGLSNNQFGQHHITSAGGRYAAQLSPGIEHHTLPLKTKNPFTLLRNAKRLYDLIVRQQISIVHARSRAPAWSALIACRWRKTPFITTYHGTYNGSSWLKMYYNSIMARGDRVIAISRFILNHIENKHPALASKITFIPEGIDTHYFDPDLITAQRVEAARQEFDVPLGSAVLFLPGRLTRWKGQAWFLNALHSRADWLRSQKICVIIVGDAQGRSDYHKELILLANDLNAAGVPVRFKTDCKDLPAAYALANIVFSCSIEPEAFGRIAAESLSMGRPFIGTNHGGTVELTGDGHFWPIVSPHDNIALLTEIERILACEKEKLTKRGEAARAHIQQHYSLHQMLRLTQELYTSVS